MSGPGSRCCIGEVARLAALAAHGKFAEAAGGAAFVQPQLAAARRTGTVDDGVPIQVVHCRTTWTPARVPCALTVVAGVPSRHSLV